MHHPYSKNRCPRLSGGGDKREVSFDDKLSIPDSSDEDDDRVSSTFQRADWIGCGHAWSDPMPREVVRARNEARAIPSAAAGVILPSADASISTVLQHRHPLHAKATNDTPPTYCDEPPNVLIDSELETADILAVAHHFWLAVPSAVVLRSTFDTAWLSGAQSIALPSDPVNRYPLWVEHLLDKLSLYWTRQQRWEACARWLSDKAGASQACATLAVECQESWEVLPSTGPVPGFGPAVKLSMADLSIFLSVEWLNDEMINAGLDYILRDVPKTSRLMLVNSMFVNSLRAMHQRQKYRSWKNSQLDNGIRAQEIDVLYIPTHVHNSHWTLLSINLVQRTYSYSDSLDPVAQPPPEILQLLCWWLCKLRPDFGDLHQVDALYEMPQQADTYSCGVIVLSTLASHLLDHEPWTPETEPAHRMQWFLRLSADPQDGSEVCARADNLTFLMLIIVR